MGRGDGSTAGFCGALIALVAALVLGLGAGAANAEDTRFFELAPATFASSMTSGPDGNLWFTATSFADGGTVVGRLTPDGRLTEFPVSERRSSPERQSIVSGPDGNLWFTEPRADAIGRISPAGELTMFALPQAGGLPTGIALGPDGNLWFTEEGVDRIGRISVSGEITEFSLPRGRRPTSIAAGGDGNLWFTERDVGRIGRMTVQGRITYFPVPGAKSRPGSIVAGDDGNLWFTDLAGHRIGRITPLGVVTRFAVPTRFPTETIVKAPNGDLWFSTREEIGSISPTGRVFEPVCLVAFCNLPVRALAVRPDGGLWFAAGPEFCADYCGGGSGHTALGQPGKVGELVPRPPDLAIGPRARAVAGGRTDLRLACSLPTGCAGVLRLRVVVSEYRRFKRRSGRRRRVITAARRSYVLGAGESRRVRLRLTPRALKELEIGRRYATATAGPPGQVEATRYPIVLRLRRGTR